MMGAPTRVLLALAAGVALLLAGCAAQPSLPAVANPQQAWQARQSRLAQIAHWELYGRIGVHNAEHAWQGSLVWRQSPARYSIEVDGPFGQSEFQLQGGPDGVLLRTSNNRQRWATDPERLLYQETGLSMPVTGLRYWVRGLPAADKASGPVLEQKLDARGRLRSLTQDGWHVRILGYTEVGGFELPEKVFIRRGEIGLRLVVDRWRLYTAHGLETRLTLPETRSAPTG